MPDLCVMSDCSRQVAPYSRVACTDHAADVEREMSVLRAQSGHACPTHPLETEPMFSGSDGMSERVLIYGSRTWRDPEPIRAFIATLPPGTIVVHGDQRSYDKDTGELYGADYLADQAAKTCGLPVEPYPVQWTVHENCRCRSHRGRCLGAGPRRNAEMVATKLTRARGYRMPGKSNGTDGMTRLLEKAGIPHEVVESIGEERP